MRTAEWRASSGSPVSRPQHEQRASLAHGLQVQRRERLVLERRGEREPELARERGEQTGRLLEQPLHVVPGLAQALEHLVLHLRGQRGGREHHAHEVLPAGRARDAPGRGVRALEESQLLQLGERAPEAGAGAAPVHVPAQPLGADRTRLVAVDRDQACEYAHLALAQLGLGGGEPPGDHG
jgi:hypothetical protein